MMLPNCQSNAASFTSGATFQHAHTHAQRNEHSLPKAQATNTDALPLQLHETTSNGTLLPTTRNGNYTPLTSSTALVPPSNDQPPSPQHSITQTDGPADHRSRMHTTPLPLPIPNPNQQRRGPPANPNSNSNSNQPAKSAYRDLLPYCTTEKPLTEQQVIRLSDIAGTLREVVVLAVRARTDERAASVLREAVGEVGWRGIVEFWEEEFEI